MVAARKAKGGTLPESAAVFPSPATRVKFGRDSGKLWVPALQTSRQVNPMSSSSRQCRYTFHLNRACSLPHWDTLPTLAARTQSARPRQGEAQRSQAAGHHDTQATALAVMIP